MTLDDVVKDYSKKHTIAFQVMKAAEAIQNIDRDYRAQFCENILEVIKAEDRRDNTK